MPSHDLEISISQYLDGTLPAGQRAAVEALVAGDGAARAVLEEDRGLTALLRSQVLPQIDWDQFTGRVGAAVDAQSAAPARQASWRFRLGAPGILALAASMLLAAGIAVHLLLGPHETAAPAPHPPIATALLVEGPELQVPSGPAIIDVSVGPGATYEAARAPVRRADEIAHRPAHVVIAAGYYSQPAADDFPF